jgi:hypothetical protein
VEEGAEFKRRGGQRSGWRAADRLQLGLDECTEHGLQFVILTFIYLVNAVIKSVIWIRIGFNADPELTFYLNEDPYLDPGSQTNAAPDRILVRLSSHKK